MGGELNWLRKIVVFMVEIIGDKITLKFAEEKDSKTIYDMMVCDEVGQFMFNEDYPAPTWEQFIEEESSYFPGKASRQGSYLIIYHEGRRAGAINYVCGYEKAPYAELNIWLAGYEFMGKKIGCSAVELVKEFIHKAYKVEHFIIRPWTRNLTAIQAYNRCGFYENASFNLNDYYSDETMKTSAGGGYGPRETVNLYCNYVKENV